MFQHFPLRDPRRRAETAVSACMGRDSGLRIFILFKSCITVSRLKVCYRNTAFEQYKNAQTGIPAHACAYGCFCAAAGIPEREMLEHYLYSQTSAMVTNCVKSIPLSQTAGQQILTDTFEIFDKVLDQVMGWGEEMLCAAAPGFDSRCMEHERLYSRIYMS